VTSTASTSVNSKTSLTSGAGGGVNNYVNETSLQGVMCEKCNRYPKFKIGVCVIYCLPMTSTCSVGGGTLSNSSLSSSFSNNSSSTSSNSSYHSPKATSHHQQHHNQSFDKFSFFPHIDSPDFNNHRNSPSSKLQKQNPGTATTTPSALPLNHSSNMSTVTSPNAHLIWNENFYEFFSSHLPLIEYQFKELKEKILSHLPLYFNPVVICGSNNISSNLVVNRRNNSFSSNNSTTSSQMSEANDTNFNNGLRAVHQHFTQQIFIVSFFKLKPKYSLKIH